jgi:asparagine N-glycosylation enzyme membrane subunit Stt3
VNRDPFAPPSSNVEVPDTKRGSAIKAVLLGLATDLGGTMVATLLVAIVYGGYLGGTGSTPEEAAASVQVFSYDSPMGIVVSVVGTLFSVLGGFVCARVARHSEYRLGGIMCAISIVLIVLTSGQQTQAAMLVIPTVATLAAIMIGIHLGVRKNRAGR